MDDYLISDIQNMQVEFPCLECLDILELDNVKKIWDNQIPQDYFSKLKEVRVRSCGEVLNTFPSSMLKRLQSLRRLRAEDCRSLEEVFDVEGMDKNVNVKGSANAKEESVTVVPSSKLILSLVPKVEKIWNKDPHGILAFQDLKSTRIVSCQSLKNLFPASLVRDLVELQKLKVSSCERIAEIIAKEDGVERV